NPPYGDTHYFAACSVSNGRVIPAPLAWYPRLVHATPQERNHGRLMGHVQGIHWEELDEDISGAGLLAGKPSVESPSSLKNEYYTHLIIEYKKPRSFEIVLGTNNRRIKRSARQVLCYPQWRGG
ncbi:MAG: DUF2442 domain-containing protein, partial [Gammaproteobacteria bacterium]|nr:DUF2442 domain-containing protein [Gammaproteobacteria bacterium]